MKKYQSPDILFQNVSPVDVVTFSFLSLFDETAGQGDQKLSWGQVNGDPEIN